MKEVKTEAISTEIEFGKICPKIWAAGPDYILYATPKVAKQLLDWNAMKKAGVCIMAEYEDAKGRLFAYQIRFPARFYNRVARAVGLPVKKYKPLSPDQKAKLLEVNKATRFKPSAKTVAHGV